MADNNPSMQVNFPQALQLIQQERATLEALDIRLSNFQRMLEETLMVKETLEALQKITDKTVMVGLGAGVFADATLSNPKRVKVTLGGGIIQEDSVENALTGLANREKEARENITQLEEERRKLLVNLSSLNTLARSLAPNVQQ
jgi:prefoldin alpha subunit